MHIPASELATEMTNFVSRLGVTTGAQDAQFAAAPLTRSGQVLVATTLPGIIPSIDDWFGKLDVALDSERTRRYVYRAQQLDAETLSQAVLASFADMGEDGVHRRRQRGRRGGGLSSLLDTGPQPVASGAARARSPDDRRDAARQTTPTSSSRAQAERHRRSRTTDHPREARCLSRGPRTARRARRPPRQVYLQVVIAEVTISAMCSSASNCSRSKGLGDYDVELRTANNLVEAATGSFFVLGKNAFALVEAAEQGRRPGPRRAYIFTVSGQSANLEVGVDQPIITQFIRGGVDATDPTRQSNQVSTARPASCST